MRRYILFLISMCVCVMQAQTTSEQQGSVLEAVSGKPVVGANVIVKNNRGKLVSFTTSDKEGKFVVKLPQGQDSLFATATMIGFKPVTLSVLRDGKPLVFSMSEGALQLDEVVVKGAKIRENGDTITYNVSSFAQKQDKSIGDVMKRMPGIDVSENGKIQYQGAAINKFYIEGSDLLGGKYGIATNGISHQDIGAVEVMENHQPLRVLQGMSFSDRAAINLKMKNKSKASFLVHGTLGGGWSQQPEGMLWQGDIFTMMVTGKYQMITTFKGNNTGTEISDQLTDFTSEKTKETLSGYISVVTPTTPNLKRKRSYFNRSWMVSSSHLLKTKGGDEFKAQVDYFNDRMTAAGNSTTTYFLENGDKIINEDRNSLTHKSALTGNFSFEANRKKYFLNNTLTADFAWSDRTLAITGTLPNTQYVNTPDYMVRNRLKIIRRFGGNKIVTFNSVNEWNSAPESLTVSHADAQYGQEISQHSFYTQEEASLTFGYKYLRVGLDVGLSGFFRKLGTNLWGELPENDLVKDGDITTDYLRIYASPKLEWGWRDIELTLRLPVNLYQYFFSAGLANRTEFFISPTLSVRYRITPKMSFSVSAGSRRVPASLHNIHESSILTDYRSFSGGVDDYYTATGQSVSAAYSYRSGMNGIFLMASGSYGWNKSKFGTVQNLVGDYIFHTYRSQPSSSRNAVAMVMGSKTVNFLNGTLGLRANYRRNESNLLSQNVATDTKNDYVSIEPYLNGTASKYFNWMLRFTWEKSVLNISGISNRSTDNFLYFGSISVIPFDWLTWTTGGEFYRNQIETDRHKDMLMLDTKLTFNVTKKIEISAGVTNLLNHRSYDYTTFGIVSQCQRTYSLRGREFMVSVYLKK